MTEWRKLKDRDARNRFLCDKFIKDIFRAHFKRLQEDDINLMNSVCEKTAEWDIQYQMLIDEHHELWIIFEKTCSMSLQKLFSHNLKVFNGNVQLAINNV